MQDKEERRDGPERNVRIGIPNIPAGAMPWYLSVFAVITVYLAVSNTLVEVNAKDITGWMAFQYVVTSELIRAGAAALIASPIITEVSRVVIGAIWSERRERKAREQGLEQGLEQGREQGRAEGEASANLRWSEWNQRRKEAEEQDLPFTEPEPASRTPSTD